MGKTTPRPCHHKSHHDDNKMTPATTIAAQSSKQNVGGSKFALGCCIETEVQDAKNKNFENPTTHEEDLNHGKLSQRAPEQSWCCIDENLQNVGEQTKTLKKLATNAQKWIQLIQRKPESETCHLKSKE